MIPTHSPRHIPIKGVYNLRDLGGYATASGQNTRFGQVLRSDSPHRLDASGVQQLLNLGVRSVIDLRNAAEQSQQPNPLAQHSQVAYSPIAIWEPLHKGGHFGPGLELPQLYSLALEHAAQPLSQALLHIAQSEGTVLFHCTAGKDRTGLVAMLLLELLGVADQDIANDYALTAELAAPLIEELRQQAAQKGANLEHYNRLLLAQPDFMHQTLRLLQQRFGGAQGFLQDQGWSTAQIEALRAKLL